MNEISSQRESRYRVGVRGWFLILLAGAICAALLPILPLVASAAVCGMGMLCFLVDYSSWVAGICGVLGFTGGMFVAYKLAAQSHKKGSEEQPVQPEMTLDRRQHEARMAWLDHQGRERFRR